MREAMEALDLAVEDKFGECKYFGDRTLERAPDGVRLFVCFL